MLVLSIPKQKEKYQQKKNSQAIAVLHLLIALAVKQPEKETTKAVTVFLIVSFTLYSLLKKDTIL